MLQVKTLSILEFPLNVPGRLLLFGKFGSQENTILSFFQLNTKIGRILNVDYNAEFCKENSPPV